VLYKAVFGNQRQESLSRGKVIGDAVLLTGARGTSGVYMRMCDVSSAPIEDGKGIPRTAD
jgi:hypothetical protein